MNETALHGVGLRYDEGGLSVAIGMAGLMAGFMNREESISSSITIVGNIGQRGLLHWLYRYAVLKGK